MDRKSLLLFGKSGSGKSTIANYLLNKNLFIIGENTVQETTNITVKFNEKYLITEMIGIGETEYGIVPHYDALNKNINYLKKCNNSYDLLCYVVQAGRFDYEDYKLWKDFANLFYGYENNFIMIFTNINSNNYWLRNNEEKIRNLYKDFSNIKMFYVNISETQNNLKNMIDTENFEKIFIKISLLYIIKIKTIIVYRYIKSIFKRFWNL